MSNAGISFGGLASGLDTRAIISALLAVERRPITALQTKKTSLNKQKSLFTDLKGLLEKLEEKARALKTTSNLLQMQVTSSNEDVLTASAGSAATPGTHQVEVVQLASAQIRAAGRDAKDSPIFGDGTIFLDINGTVHGVDIGAGTGFAGTLDGIAQAINAQGLDVRADVIDTGQPGPEKFQLVLRSTVVGTEGAFSLTLDTGNAELGALIDDLNASTASPAANAEIRLNGVSVFRSSNSISDVIPGVTLDLHSAEPGSTVTVTVSTDGEETSGKVKELVDAYNEIVDFVSTQNQVGENGEARNPLFGDSTLRSIRTSLRSIVGGRVDTGNEAVSLLVQIGITSDRDGKLTFNQGKFEEMLATDEQAVAGLFAGTGIATQLTDRIDAYNDSVDGLLKTRQDGFDRLIRDAQRRIDQGEERLERFEQSLEQRFANLESLLARLQGQGTALGGLPTFNR